MFWENGKKKNFLENFVQNVPKKVGFFFKNWLFLRFLVKIFKIKAVIMRKQKKNDQKMFFAIFSKKIVIFSKFSCRKWIFGLISILEMYTSTYITV